MVFDVLFGIFDMGAAIFKHSLLSLDVMSVREDAHILEAKYLGY